MDVTIDREAAVEVANPAGLEGLEFVEFSTPRPQALGHLLETVGFRPVARHRSREVLLYRQGTMNVVVNGHEGPAGPAAHPDDAMPRIAAVALRTRDAAAAWRRAVALGAWPAEVQVQAMELHIPGIVGPDATRIYFVDRWREFSIFDIDFVPIPTVEHEVAATAGLHWFGIVQYVGAARADDWCHFYAEILGFEALPRAQRFGILPAGRILRSPCGSWHLQLVEPEPDAEHPGPERFQRVAFGTPDVAEAVRELQARGLPFVEAGALRPSAAGALSRAQLGSVMFELVGHVAP